MSQEGQKEFFNFCEEKIYKPKTLVANFSTWVRKSFMCYAPTMLGMPDDMFVNIMKVTDGKYTFNQMNVLLQVLVQVSGKAMDMTADEYITYRESIKLVAEDFHVTYEGHKDAYIEKYPYVEVIPVAEPAEA